MRAYEYTDEQTALQGVVRRLCGDVARSRPALEHGVLGDPELVAGLRDLGVLAIGIPETHGGGGGSVIDQLVVAHELGRVVSPAPFVSTTMAAGTLLAAAEGVEDLVAAVAAGATVAVAFATTLVQSPDGRVIGVAQLVADAVGAHTVLLVAANGDQPAVVAVSPQADGVTLTDHPALDRGRPLATLHLDRAPIRRLRIHDPGSAVQAAKEVWWIGLAAESTGLAERCLELTTAYALQRRQFDEVIGRFQAVKHRLADDLVLVENARAACRWAGWATVDDDADRSPAASAAKAVATGNAVTVAGDAIQLHGGTAITWEHDLHLYLRRARTNAQLGGSPSEHRERVASHLLATGSPGLVVA